MGRGNKFISNYIKTLQTLLPFQFHHLRKLEFGTRLALAFDWFRMEAVAEYGWLNSQRKLFDGTGYFALLHSGWGCQGNIALLAELDTSDICLGNY